jgi:hypothetical protein
MKTLVTLSVLQTIGIVALVVHVIREEHPAPPEQHTPNSSVAIPPDTSSRVISAAPALDEERLRSIIREELARLQIQPATQGSASPVVATRQRDPVSDARQREVVAQQIEAYAATGAITESQMQELQADIAQLDDASRKQMMSKLIRALNSGDIKGRL